MSAWPDNRIEIASSDDPRISDYQAIREKDLRGHDEQSGLFVAEQALVVQKMLEQPGATKSLLLGPTWGDRLGPMTPPEVPVYVATIEVIKEVAGFNLHRGVLGVGFRNAVERRAITLPPPPAPATVLVCDDIRNLDNIGLLFRNAAVFGVDAVLLSPACHDPLYRKSLRVSIGHALTVPFARASSWPDELSWFKRDHEMTLIGAATGPDACPLDTIERPRRVMLAVGQEFDGLQPATITACDRLTRIPMVAGVDSLNVATAAAICLHHFSTAPRL